MQWYPAMALQHREQHLDVLEMEPCGGFVEEDDLGIVDEGGDHGGVVAGADAERHGRGVGVGGLQRGVELQQGHYQEAVDAAETAIEMGSTDLAVFRARWEAYRLLGNEEMTLVAQADLEKSGQLAEEAKRIYNEGDAKLKIGDKEGAIRSCEGAR